MSTWALILRDEKHGEFSRVREFFHPDGAQDWPDRKMQVLFIVMNHILIRKSCKGV
jgi:hypothetical protein